MLRTAIQSSEMRAMFQLFFLKNDASQSVEVEEVKNVDFAEIRKHLLQGESVFIACKSNSASKELDLSKKRRQSRVFRRRGFAS